MGSKYGQNTILIELNQIKRLVIAFVNDTDVL